MATHLLTDIHMTLCEQTAIAHGTINSLQTNLYGRHSPGCKETPGVHHAMFFTIYGAPEFLRF